MHSTYAQSRLSAACAGILDREHSRWLVEAPLQLKRVPEGEIPEDTVQQHVRRHATAYTAKQQACLQSGLFCFASAHPRVSSQQQAARNHDPGCRANVFQPKKIDIKYVSWRHPCMHNVTPCYPNLSQRFRGKNTTPHLRSPALRAPVTGKTYLSKKLY